MSMGTQPNQQPVVKTGGANLQRGRETVGGHLTLTADRLIFSAHKLNLQTGAVEIPLSEIRGTRLVWTKFLNVLPIAPNSLAVDLADGTVHAFVLFGRKEWKTAIDDAVAAQR